MPRSFFTPEVLRAFSDEMHKVGGFALVGGAAKGLGRLGAKGLGAATATPGRALATLGVGGTLAGGTYLAAKGAKKGWKEHSYGNLPGSRGGVATF